MAVESISKSSLSIQDFLRILTSQLNNQDPLKPMDNQEFVAQLAQFTTLQQSQQLNEKIDSLLSIQAATQSVGLIGRNVELNTASGQQSGRVTALDFSSGQPQLSVTLSSGNVLDNISLSSLIRVF